MITRFRRCFLVLVCQMACFLLVCPVFGQQTLGGLTGVVTDNQGGILAGTVVTAVGRADRVEADADLGQQRLL